MRASKRGFDCGQIRVGRKIVGMESHKKPGHVVDQFRVSVRKIILLTMAKEMILAFCNSTLRVFTALTINLYSLSLL